MRRLKQCISIAGLLFATSAQIFSQTGMLFGKDHSFYMTAPQGWVLDNKSGVKQGVHMVFYPRGFTYQNSPVIAYGQSSPLTDSIRTIEDWVKSTIQDFKDNGSTNCTGRKEKTIQLPGGMTAEIYFYSGDRWGNYEAAGYILEKKTINFLVFNSRYKKAFDDNIAKFYEILNSYKNVYRENTQEYTEGKFKDYLKKAEEDKRNPEGKAYEDLLTETQTRDLVRLFQECLAYEKKDSAIPGIDAVFIVGEDGTIVDSYVWPVTTLSVCLKGSATSLKLPRHTFNEFHWHVSLEINVKDRTIDAPPSEPSHPAPDSQGQNEGPQFLQIGNLPLNLFSIRGCYNPYEYWSWFKPGSSVTFKIMSDVGGAKTISRKKFEVKGLTQEQISILVKGSFDIDNSRLQGVEYIQGENSTMVLHADIPPWEDNDLFHGYLSLNFSEPRLFLDADGISIGKEEIDIKGNMIDTQRFTLTFEAPQAKTSISIWYADDIPGGIARYTREVHTTGTSVLEEILVEDFYSIKKNEAEFRNPPWAARSEVPGSTFLGKKLKYFEDARIVEIEWGMFLKSVKEKLATELLPKLSALLEDAKRWKSRFEEDLKSIDGQLSKDDRAKLEPFLNHAALYCQAMLDYIVGEHENLLQVFNQPETIDLSFKQKVENFHKNNNPWGEVRNNYIAARDRLKDIWIQPVR